MIHETALVDEKARIADNVSVGPYSIIGPDVEIGEGTEIGPYVTISNRVKIGRNNTFFRSCVIGENPQDVSFDNDEAEVVIGDNNIFREFVTVHQPSVKGNQTRVGDNNFFMVETHLAHDVIVGNHVTLVNQTGAAGHVIIDDYAFISGLVMLHQFVRVGQYAIIGGSSKATRDIPPFTMANGNPALIRGLNVVGLKRSGMSPSERSVIKKAFQILYLKGNSVKKAEEIITDEIASTLEEGSGEKKRIDYFLDFLKGSEKRGISSHSGEDKASPVE